MTEEQATILIVEDDPATRNLTKRVLVEAGYETMTAETGAEGLQVAQSASPDLILLDVMLPDMNGIDVCRQLKASSVPEQPHVILLSAMRTATDEQALGLESGADGYIARPIANRELLARVEAMLRLRRLETQLRRQERLAAVGQLAAGLAHNLNSILQGLLLRAELTAADPELPPRVRRSLQQLTEETKKGAVLVQQLLDFSRQSVIQPQVLSLAPLIEETARAFKGQSAPAVYSRVALVDDQAKVWGDAVRLHQLLRNLARNAVEAMPHGGELLLGLDRGPVSERCIVCGAHIEGEWVQMMVCDEGVGITEDVAARMFEPFFSTRVPQQRGLGLSQALGIVKQHGGHLTVESEVGVGTTVTVYLQPYEG